MHSSSSPAEACWQEWGRGLLMWVFGQLCCGVVCFLDKNGTINCWKLSDHIIELSNPPPPMQKYDYSTTWKCYVHPGISSFPRRVQAVHTQSDALGHCIKLSFISLIQVMLHTLCLPLITSYSFFIASFMNTVRVILQALLFPFTK